VKEERSSFLKKRRPARGTKKLLRAGVGKCGVFNRLQRRRLKTPQTPQPARKSFLRAFFQKSAAFLPS
jgi:hypothetical protein